MVQDVSHIAGDLHCRANFPGQLQGYSTQDKMAIITMQLFHIPEKIFMQCIVQWAGLDLWPLKWTPWPLCWPRLRTSFIACSLAVSLLPPTLLWVQSHHPKAMTRATASLHFPVLHCIVLPCRISIQMMKQGNESNWRGCPSPLNDTFTWVWYRLIEWCRDISFYG